MKHTLLCLMIASVCWMPQSALPQESVETLAKNMPPGANAVMVANIGRIRGSQVARAERWFDSHSAKIESGVGFLPQGTDTVIFASQLDYASFTPLWTSGYLTFRQAPSLEQLSRQVSGTMDKIARQAVLHTNSDLFVFRHTTQTVGTYSPANRQNFATWLVNSSTGSDSPLNPYLMNAITSRGKTTAFVMAFDLSNVVSSNSVFQRAKDSDALQGARIDPQQFSDLMASVKGVTISVGFDTQINANLVINFGENAGLAAPVAKQLMTEFMDNHGVHVDDLAGWRVQAQGNRISTGGLLSKKGLRRLISLFDTPEPHMTAPMPAEPTADASSLSTRTGEATKQYFDAVKSILSELEKDIGQASLSTYLYQKWLKSYADEIDNLSMHNVDSDMLDFGAWVAQSFRQISLRTTHGHQSVDVQDKNLIAYNANAATYRYRGYGSGGYGYGYGYGYGPGYGPGLYPWRNQTATQADRMAIHQRARSKTIDFGADLFTQVKDREAEVRRLMTEKYPDQF